MFDRNGCAKAVPGSERRTWTADMVRTLLHLNRRMSGVSARIWYTIQ